MKKTLFSLAMFCFVATSLFAQKKIKNEAHVGYEITDVKSEDAMAGMMKGSTVDFYITKENSHSNINMMSGMVTMKSYVLKGTDKPVMLMQMMGQKIKIVQGDDAKKEVEAVKPKFIFNKKVTKEIKGYKCHEVKSTMKDGTVLTLFVTDKIDLTVGKGMNIFGVSFNQIDGFPLEIDISSKGGGMTITAQKIEEKVDDTVFKYDDKGYKEMTEEELQKMGIGMGF